MTQYNTEQHNAQRRRPMSPDEWEQRERGALAAQAQVQAVMQGQTPPPPHPQPSNQYGGEDDYYEDDYYEDRCEDDDVMLINNEKYMRDVMAGPPPDFETGWVDKTVKKEMPPTTDDRWGSERKNQLTPSNYAPTRRMSIQYSELKHKVLFFNDMVNSPWSNPDYVVPGLPLGVVGSLIAPGGAGKSMFALQRAISIAVGRDNLTCGRVMYIAAEDPIDMISDRVKGIKEVFRLSDREKALCQQNFFVVPLIGKTLDIMHNDWIEGERVNAFHQFISEAATDALKLGEKPTRLVIIDTLRRVHTKDENSGADMSELLNVMEKVCVDLNLSIIFLHHTNKTAALSGSVDLQQASRGSSVLVDNIRYQEFMSTMTKDESKMLATAENPNSPIDNDRYKYVRWGSSKQNFGKKNDDIWYERGKYGVLLRVDLKPFNKSRQKYKEQEETIKRCDDNVD